MMKILTIIIVLMFFLCDNQSFAQDYSITFAQDVGNPGGINTESDNSTAGWTTLMSGNQNSNTWSPSTPLPFPFVFYGQSVTDFSVSQNGIISFETIPSTLSLLDNEVLPSTQLGNLSIAAFWDEFTYNPPTTTSSNILTKTFGTAPNRQFWIKFSSFEIGTSSTTATWSVVLEETTNNIYIVDMNFFSGSNLNGTVGVQFNTTKGVCYNNSNFVGFDNIGSSAITDNDVYTFSPLYDYDSQILSIDSPTAPFAAGNLPIAVSLRNLGLINLTSATIEWSVNGVPQTPFAWSGNLAPLATENGIIIGNVNFVAGNGYNIEVWTFSPNGQTDQNPANDTISKLLYPGFSGVYTIGGPSADFSDFLSATQALKYGGVLGPVTFNVNPSYGPYVGQVVLSKILGNSAVNTITFNGSANKDTIQFSSNSATNTATVLLDSVFHVSFQNLTFLAAGSAYGVGIKITNQCSNISINDCNVYVNTTGTLEDYAGIEIAGSDYTTPGFYGENIQISNCTINGGYYGIYYLGRTNSPLLDVGNFTNNSISNAYAKGVFVSNGKNFQFADNSVILRTNSAATSIGLEINNIDIYQIEKNTIQKAREIGLKIHNSNYQSNSPVVRAKVINNMIGGGFTSMTNSRGIRFTGTNNRNTDVWHNSVSLVNVNGRALEITGGNGFDIRNNSFAVFGSSSAYALYINSTGSISQLDYNNYFAGTSNNIIYVAANYTVANFIGGGGYNANSKHGDPGYANHQTNLHARRSQLNDSGTNLGITVDIDGDVRPLPPGVVPDIGADEFNPPQADLGVIDITLPDDYSCGKVNDTIIITVKNFGLASQSNIPVRTNIFGAGNQIIDGTIPGPVAPNTTATLTITNFNTNLTGTYYVKSFTMFPQDTIFENDTLLSFVTILKTPSVIGQNVLICDSGSATLTVVPETNVQYTWHTSPGGQLVGTGHTYITPTLYNTTSYYVQGINRVASHVGPSDTTLGTGNFSTVYSNGTKFNVYRNCNIDSLVVYSSNGGNLVINLKNSSNAILDSRTFTIPSAGKHQLFVDFAVTPGMNYRLDLSGSSSVSLYQNTSGALYPYTVNGVIEISGNTSNQVARYFYLYDWVVTINSCESNFVPVTAIIGQSPNVNLGPDVTVCDTAYLDATVPGINNPAQYVWNSGAIGPVLKATSSGMYFVEVTSSNGCKKRDSVNVVILNGSSVNLGNDTTLACSDSLVIDLGTGASYEWSTGDTTSSISIKSPGTYWVRVFQGLCESRDTITVNFDGSVSLGNDTTIGCGGSVTFNPGLNGAYLWSDGSTDTTLTVSSSGLYWVQITLGGCILTDSVLVIVNSEDNLGWGTDTTGCFDVTLNAVTSGATSYLWSTGDVIPAITATTSGQYFVEIQLNNGCFIRDTINVTIDVGVPDVNILLNDSTEQGQTVTVIADVTNPAYTYTWDFGQGATPPTATGPGPHNVKYDSLGVAEIQLIVTGGCGNDTTIKTLTVIPVGNTPEWASQIQIYPNPFQNQLLVNISENQFISLKIWNINGQKVYQSEKVSGRILIDTNTWNSGVYFVQIDGKKGIYTQKLIKN